MDWKTEDWIPPMNTNVLVRLFNRDRGIVYRIGGINFRGDWSFVGEPHPYIWTVTHYWATIEPPQGETK